MEPEKPPGSEDASKEISLPADSKRHPLIGWMKGTVYVARGVDLTEPADPEWAGRIDINVPAPPIRARPTEPRSDQPVER